MAALQDFDQALSSSAGTDLDTWVDDGLVVAGELAAKLSEEELSLLRMIWTARPLLWQQHCAEVLGSACLDEAIELLMDMVAKGKPDVALAAPFASETGFLWEESAATWCSWASFRPPLWKWVNRQALRHTTIRLG